MPLNIQNHCAFDKSQLGKEDDVITKVEQDGNHVGHQSKEHTNYGFKRINMNFYFVPLRSWTVIFFKKLKRNHLFEEALRQILISKLDAFNKPHKSKHFATIWNASHNSIAHYGRSLNTFTFVISKTSISYGYLIQLYDVLKHGAHFITSSRCLHHFADMIRPYKLRIVLYKWFWHICIYLYL